MMETSTLQDSFCNNSKDDAVMNTLTDTEKCFYDDIRPALNTLVKHPSDEIVNNILAYSKSL